MSKAPNIADARLCARGEHELQAALYANLGARWATEGAVAQAVGPVPHRFLFGAVTLEPGADPCQLSDVEGDICDSFAEFRADQLPGWVSGPADRWMLRRPGPPPASALPAGVGIRAAATGADVDRWEAASFLANDDVRTTPGELHPTRSFADTRQRCLLAEHDGSVIGTALGVIAEDTLTISAVTVVPEWRGRGIGGELTRSVLQLAPVLTATLSASDLGHGVYRRLGFVDAGRPMRWMRAAS